MATNLVSLVMQFLTPDVIGRIAAALGLDRNAAQTGVNTAVPSLLAGLASAAAQPGGAQKLVDAATQQAGVLENFESTLGGAGRSSFIENGSQMLSSLLGSRDQNALSGAIARFAGIGQNTTSERRASIRAGLQTFLHPRRTISPRRCLPDSAICWRAPG